MVYYTPVYYYNSSAAGYFCGVVSVSIVLIVFHVRFIHGSTHHRSPLSFSLPPSLPASLPLCPALVCLQCVPLQDSTMLLLLLLLFRICFYGY